MVSGSVCDNDGWNAEWCQDLLAKVGDRWFAPIAIIQNWTYCWFYVMAELWGSVVISVRTSHATFDTF